MMMVLSLMGRFFLFVAVSSFLFWLASSVACFGLCLPLLHLTAVSFYYSSNNQHV